jgi:hypothetical protein
MQLKFKNLQNSHFASFKWGFDLASYFTPAYAGINGNVAVHAAVTDSSLNGAFISFKSCIKEGTLL